MAILRVKPTLQKPVVGGSINEWGDILNSNIDAQDNFNNSVLMDSEAKGSEIERLDREKVSKTDVDAVVKTSVDEYINTNGKIKLNEHVETVNKPELDKYTETKKTDIQNTAINLGFYDTNGGVFIKQWLGSEEEYLKTNKYNNRIYSVFSPEESLLKQYLYKFKSPKDYFDKRISLYFGGNENGYYMYNDPSDPMPINTLNNSGLKVWEETEDYFIYIDKDTVTTRVEQYVTGSYQTFLERKADIESNMELVKTYTTWTEEDDSSLFIQCNNEALEKLAKSPSIIPETGEENPPPVLEPKTVPTSYNCCFRADRNTGEIYINEGYENFTADKNYFPNGEYTIKHNEYLYEINPDSKSTEGFLLNQFIDNTVPFSLNFEVEANKTLFTYANIYKENFAIWVERNIIKATVADKYISNSLYPLAIKDNTSLGKKGGVKFKFMVTKTPTPKPFVKTIMPTCKLSFITNATSVTHTFIAKGDGSIFNATETEINLYGNKKLKQFLVYKGLLTEEELKVENTKQLYF